MVVGSLGKAPGSLLLPALGVEPAEVDVIAVHEFHGAGDELVAGDVTD